MTRAKMDHPNTPEDNSQIMLVHVIKHTIRFFKCPRDAALFLVGRDIRYWQIYNRNNRAESHPDMDKIRDAMEKGMRPV